MIKEDADYEGVPVKVIAFLDRTKKVLQMDIGFGDLIVPCATEMEYQSLLEIKTPLQSIPTIFTSEFRESKEKKQ